MLTAFRARCVLPLADERPFLSSHSPVPVPVPPHTVASTLAAPLHAIHDGVLVLRNGTVEAVETYATFRRRTGVTCTDLGDVTLLPGLVNCHTHLELSHLAGRTTLGQGFVPWVKSLLPLTAPTATAHNAAAQALAATALCDAAAALAACHTTHVGDVTSRNMAGVAAALASRNISRTHFCEVFGYTLPDPPLAANLWPPAASALDDAARNADAALAGHALYSTHPMSLVLAHQWCRARGKVFSFHLAEHPDEVAFLTTGHGALRDLLAERVLPPDFIHPGLPPVRYAADLGLLDEGTLAVHCVQCSTADAVLLAESGTHVCLCPRSNAAIGTGTAPVGVFMQAGVQLCLGTDSLASNHDLDLWNEARALRDTHNLPDAALIRMLTINGASALRQPQLGSLHPGGHGAFAVLPPDFSPALRENA